MARDQETFSSAGPWAMFGVGSFVFLVLLFAVAGFVVYTVFRIEVPTRYMAVLIKKTGKDLTNGEEIAPSLEYKGLQREVLAEGRHFRNPWHFQWEVIPQPEVPEGKLGVRVRLFGDDLGYGEILARQETQKGIVPGVLRPGRYAINAEVIGAARDPGRRYDSYAEQIELHDPIVIPAGYRGVVTNLSGPLPDDPNVLLVPQGTRGVQEQTLSEGTQYVNPYEVRIDLVDCRSQRFNLSMGGEMGFPSKDGFWVTLDGIIEFRVMPDQAAHVFVTYNDSSNDSGRDARVDDEIINKVILPNARSFCRLRGSDHSGKEFISGETRIKFQEDFQSELERTCESQGIEIIQALITRINPPQQIAKPVRTRQIAVQKKEQYLKEIEQQVSEQQLAIQKEMVNQKQALIAAEQEVVKVTTQAEREQEVALIQANQQLNVAQFELAAAKDIAQAALARGTADAEVIHFENEAEAAGWRKSVQAFGGDGNEFARWVMLQKMAPAFRKMMINTADSPLMDIFRQYEAKPSLGTSDPALESAAATRN